MARFFPARSSCKFDTRGEARLADRLEKKLEDDYLCWYNVPLGPKQRQPDFVILHPSRGLLILEVKDWKLETIQSMDRHRAQLIVGDRLKSVDNPLLQARVCALEVVTTLQRDPALLQQEGPHTGKLVLPWGFGVVLTAITRRQFEQTDLGDVLNPQLVICQDEMTEAVEAEAFQQRLWDMFLHSFPCQLGLPQIDRVRYHLFPEVRVSQYSGQFGLFAADEAPISSLIKVMDLQQEQLARSLGEGHRVIHGAAGSGKTMILGYRCSHLAATSSKPVLVLCYNSSLAGRLAQVMEERGLGERVCVRNFHAWCREMLVSFHAGLPDESLGHDQKMAAMVQNTIAGVDQGLIPRGQYAAVLIDEGHDFQPDWFRLVVQMVDPDTNALLVLYDDAQSIYQQSGQRKGGLHFSFASVGIQAQGRTTILCLNYRNTIEVLSVARAFASELLDDREASEDGIPMITPQSAGRRGAFPELVCCESDWQERDLLIRCIQEEQAAGRALSDMAILYREKKHAARMELALAEAGIAFTSASSTRGRKSLYSAADSVKIVSMHSSKGLEFGLVLIPGLDDMPNRHGDAADEARLMYVAMTRAIDRLVMSHQRANDFTRRIQDSISQVRQQLNLRAVNSTQNAGQIY